MRVNNKVNNKVNNTFILRAMQIIAYRNGVNMKSGPGKGAAGRQCDRKQLVGQELTQRGGNGISI